MIKIKEKIFSDNKIMDKSIEFQNGFYAFFEPAKTQKQQKQQSKDFIYGYVFAINAIEKSNDDFVQHFFR